MVEQEIRKNEKDLIQYKKAEYQVADIYGNGTVRTYADPEYQEFKYFKNPDAGGQVDLMNEGNFIKGFFLTKPNQGKYLFNSTDRKTPLLVNQYGSGIFGMNQNKFNRFIDSFVADDFRKRIKNILNR